MHGRFTPAAAIRISRALEPFDPFWVEEPVGPDNAKALAKAAARNPGSRRDRRADPHAA